MVSFRTRDSNEAAKTRAVEWGTKGWNNVFSKLSYQSKLIWIRNPIPFSFSCCKNIYKWLLTWSRTRWETCWAQPVIKADHFSRQRGQDWQEQERNPPCKSIMNKQKWLLIDIKVYYLEMKQSKEVLGWPWSKMNREQFTVGGYPQPWLTLNWLFGEEYVRDKQTLYLYIWEKSGNSVAFVGDLILYNNLPTCKNSFRAALFTRRPAAIRTTWNNLFLII